MIWNSHDIMAMPKFIPNKQYLTQVDILLV
jgi:hypothetical protein